MPRSAVLPYQFEPQSRNVTAVSDAESGSDNETQESDGDPPVGAEAYSDSELPADVNLWCSCNRCGPMPTRRECKCCADTNIVDGKMAEADVECITLHPGFAVNCTNQYVLETSFWEYIQENGPLDPEDMIHETYRYIAYRRFVRWVYHKLGKNNRRILPSCVVTAIRDAFPSQQYCGFKYPQ